jgi:hypothetical protein
MSNSNKCRAPSRGGSPSTEAVRGDDVLKLKMSFPSGGEGLEFPAAFVQMIRMIVEEMQYTVMEHIVQRVVERVWVRSMLGDAIGVPIEIATEVLRCKESKIYELLGDGSLRRAPKHGKETQIELASIKELLEAAPPGRKGKRKKGSGGGGGWSNGSGVGLPVGVTSRDTPPPSNAEHPSRAPGEEIRKLSI